MLCRVLAGPDGHGATAVVTGAGGVGKTALVLQWAHRHAADFPDGQLYVNLRGFDPVGEPMPTAVALRGFLDALGVDHARIPSGVDAQAALYRSQLADRRMLVVLDNAHDGAQVEQLLPGSSPSGVLVTSRNHLPSLTVRGAYPVTVKALTTTEGRALLACHLEGRITHAPESGAVDELLGYCAGLPLAIVIVAARAVAHPHFPVSMLAAELTEDSTRLDGMDAGDRHASVEAVFSWSYHALSPRAAAMFRWLSQVPAPDVDLRAVASLVASSVTEARTVLGQLEAAHLIEQPVPGRYRTHDLVRLYASRRASEEHSAEERAAAQRRLVDFYLHSAHAGDLLMSPYRLVIDLEAPASGCLPLTFDDASVVLDWFKTEHQSLLAVLELAIQRGWHLQVWQLAWMLSTYHRTDSHLDDDVAAWTMGLAAAEELADPVLQAYAHRNLGRAYTRVRQADSALRHLRQAVTLGERAGDRRVEAFAHRALALDREAAGDYGAALSHAECALDLYRSLEPVEAEADSLTLVGWCHGRAGNFDESVRLTEAALRLHRRSGSREGEADSLQGLGFTALQMGRYADAVDFERQAHDLYVEIGNRFEAPKTLDLLGQALAAQGRVVDAATAWREALTVFQAQDRHEEAQRLRARMGPA